METLAKEEFGQAVKELHQSHFTGTKDFRVDGKIVQYQCLRVEPTVAGVEERSCFIQGLDEDPMNKDESTKKIEDAAFSTLFGVPFHG